MRASAFTPVETRRNFGGPRPVFVPQSSVAPPPPPAKKATKPTEWPLSVRQYVQRSFAEENSIPDVPPFLMQTKLKELINKAAEAGQLEKIDWINVPLPQQMIAKERQEAMIVPPVAAPRAPSPEEQMSQSNSTPEKTTDQPNINKKRKAGWVDQRPEDNSDSTNPPWRKSKVHNGFEDRVTYPTLAQSKKKDKRQKKFQEQTGKMQDNSKSNGMLDHRRHRFDLDKPKEEETPPIVEGPIVGTCEDIEKRYFRLTAPPRPETVRPLRVLRKTLEHLIMKWKNEGNYNYICDQFKSLRQDLTVQHIQNDFTTRAYELHARIALEKADIGEYNQCQSQLRGLYKRKLGGHPGEFLAYRILYLIYTCNRTDMNDLLANIKPVDRADAAVQHALRVRSALALGNYHRFFKLYLDTPNLGGYLMDMFLVRERLAAVARICRSYKQTIQLRFITEELAFESDELCCQFICEHGGENLFDNTNEEGVVRFATAKAGQIFDSAKSAAFAGVDIKGQI